jgi:hypothetical protein
MEPSKELKQHAARQGLHAIALYGEALRIDIFDAAYQRWVI